MKDSHRRKPSRSAKRVRSASPEKHTEALASDETEKLQKVLARAGMGSRRALESIIQEGRVRVNGH